MSELIRLPLDLYCTTSCGERRCDADRDCKMLKFRRQTEVRERFTEVGQYIETRHTAVRQSDLVERFFFDSHRQSLDAMGRGYLEREISRLLSEALLRSGRFERRSLPDGEVAWSVRGGTVALPTVAAPEIACTVSEEVSRLIEQISVAERPVGLRTALGTGELGLADLARSEERMSAALREVPEVRCVALDRRRGVGTHWVSIEWLRERLPSDAYLQPIPTDLFRPTSSMMGDWAEKEIGLLPDDEDDEADRTPATQFYTAQIDDVLAGSLVLASADIRLFPMQPNPAWVEIWDEDEVRHDGLLLRRGGQTELFGLGEILLEGGSGLRLRLRSTGVPHVFAVETRGIDEKIRDASERDSRLARRVWRELLASNRSMLLEELARSLDTTPERVRAVLQAYRCFKACLDATQSWEIDRSQPGLRPRLPDTVLDVDVVEGMIKEGRATLSALHQLDAELGWLKDGVDRLLGGRQ